MKEIYSYTTKQAVDDGVLVKIDSGILKEIGIKFPVYLTYAVYKRYVHVHPDMEGLQDLEGRLFDLLYMFAMKAKNTDSPVLYYTFCCMLHHNAIAQANESKSELSRVHKDVKLRAVISAQDIDDASPAIFIMLPWED